MTALWFAHLDAPDRVAVKPHASPVFHAIQYLLGDLDRSYLSRLRQRGGLQSYPSRTKDPDQVDFSTGSVGLGAAAPLFAAATRRYVDDHFGPRPRSRFIALVGDAELDEGNIWEAVADHATQGLGNVDVDRRLQPAVAGPRHPRHPDHAVDDAVPRRRLARRRGEVRPAAAGEVRRARRRGAARVDRRDAQRAVPVAVRAERAGPARAVPRRRARGGAPGGRRRLRRGAGAAGPGPRRARPRRRCWPRTRSATPSPTGRASSSPTRSRAGGCRSRATRATTRRCSPRTRSPCCGRARGSRPTPSGTASTRPRRPGSLCHVRREHLAAPAARRGPRGGRAGGHRDPLGQADVHPGGLRPGPRRPVARRAGAVPRDDRARTSRRRPTWPASSTAPASTTPTRSAPGTRTRCSSGPRAPAGSTSSWASAR